MEVVTHNPTSLAWIGDAMMSLHIRKTLLEKGYRKADILQKKSASNGFRLKSIHSIK